MFVVVVIDMRFSFCSIYQIVDSCPTVANIFLSCFFTFFNLHFFRQDTPWLRFRAYIFVWLHFCAFFLHFTIHEIMQIGNTSCQYLDNFDFGKIPLLLNQRCGLTYRVKIPHTVFNGIVFKRYLEIFKLFKWFLKIGISPIDISIYLSDVDFKKDLRWPSNHIESSFDELQIICSTAYHRS